MLTAMDITECLASENTEMMNAVTLRKMGQEHQVW